MRDEAPAQHLAARRALAVGRDREHLVAGRDVEAPAHLDALADREAVAQDRRVGPGLRVAPAHGYVTRCWFARGVARLLLAPSADEDHDAEHDDDEQEAEQQRRRAVPVPPNGSAMSLTIPKPIASSTIDERA